MRHILPALALVVGLSTPALAAYNGPSSGYGGFQGPTATVETNTVAKALKAWDDSPVVLTGNIVQRMAGSDDKYMFRDATGQIIVDIDYELFWGKTVTPNNTVRISGEVDKDMFEPTKIDVKLLEVIK
ncbi:NirD/YgiW/YdeI family stress tolerance protein [uncultured Desulfovibrio sp.]|uniref:NirD/YgiW/YdeI family stress tolerance protein n=1 Tax=Candidatus Desulfovibrio intestinavium TaxID=2838534 RepID=A0A9D2HNB2_9BACT|nr:NirD/YgiW/YdeI family stress tolerance protein [uncultured Desulfovibrio sp.]HJA78904.1 NirD/YgiW/YdeI family stress tolerance protein [Candidatus Desulfovibrio intestinavium]